MKMTNNKVHAYERRYSYTLETALDFKARIVENAGNSGDSRTIQGYGVVFNQKSRIIYEYAEAFDRSLYFYEIIEPQAFDRLLANNWNGVNVVLDVNHDTSEILATLNSGTLRLSKDGRGLTYGTELPVTSRGEDVLQMVKRGDYFESSFKYFVEESGERWELDRASGIYTHYVTDIALVVDFCVATYMGAFQNTDIQVVNERKYDESDIAISKERLLKRTAIREESTVTEENTDYLIESELDADKIKILG
jgi:HK97 family phage prohead protease